MKKLLLKLLLLFLFFGVVTINTIDAGIFPNKTTLLKATIPAAHLSPRVKTTLKVKSISNNAAAATSVTAPADANATTNSAIAFSAVGTSVGVTASSTVSGNNGINLASGKTAMASSMESAMYPPSYVTDGAITGNRWSSAFTDPQWIYIDLGATYNIDQVVLYWEAAYGKTFDIQVSNLPGFPAGYTTIYSTTTGAGGVNTLTATAAGSGRYVRMYGTVRGSTFGYSLFEFQVYGSTPPVYSLSTNPSSFFAINSSTGAVTLNSASVTPGTYTIGVTATSGAATNTSPFTVTIVPATPAISGASSGCGAGSVTLTGSGGAPAGGTYNWYNVASGGTALASSTSTTYAPPVSGTYYLSYTSGGVESARSAGKAVTINPVPAASFTAPASIGVGAGASVSLTSAYDNTATYNWDFGTNATPATNTGQGPFTVSWSSAGSKTVTLTVTNSSGCSVIITQTVTVNNNYIDWTGNTSTDWNTASNWNTNTVPTINDVARVAVNTSVNYIRQPIISAVPASTITNVGDIILGTKFMTGGFNNINVELTVNTLLNIKNSFVANSDFTGGASSKGMYQIIEIKGTGNIQTPSFNCGDGSLATLIAGISAGVYLHITGTMTVAGDITIKGVLNSTNDLGPAALYIGSGTISCDRLVTINNSASAYSYVFMDVSGLGDIGTGMLQLNNKTPIVLSGTGNNSFVLSSSSPLTNSTVNYTNNNAAETQVVYTKLPSNFPAGYAAYFSSTKYIYDNITFTGAAAKQLDGAGAITVSGDWNSTGGKINMNNSGAVFTSKGAQAITDNTDPVNGIKFYNVTFSSDYNGTVSNTTVYNKTLTGVFSVNSTSTLTLGTYTTLNAPSSGSLSFNSDASGSASVAAIPSTSSVTGNVIVKRYIGGGTGRRTYRYVSAPVNQGSTASVLGGVPYFGFTDVQKNVIITGGGVTTAYAPAVPSSNFDGSPLGNPSVYFYYENDADPNTRIISLSDYKGINLISAKMPVANGFLMFFRGNRAATDSAGVNKLITAGNFPQTTYLNFTGNLNQGGSSGITVNIPVNPVVSGKYATPATVQTAFTYTPHGTALTDGFHLVGNPYACTIDLENLSVTNPSANMAVYMLNNVGVMGSYVRGTNSTAIVNGVGRYVLSGQGFMFQGNTAGTTTLNFPESCKVTNISSSFLPSSFAVTKQNFLAADKNTVQAVKNTTDVNDAEGQQQQNLLIKLSLDSINTNETLIRFGEKTHNKYNGQEDAYYNSGITQTTFMASYSSDAKPLLINQMGSLDSIKTIPLYAEGQTSGLYTLKFTGAASVDPRYKLLLMDYLKKDSLDLSANDTYTFNIDRSNAKTYGDSRFALVVRPTHIAAYYHLNDFTGAKSTAGVLLSWTTQYEGDYTGFTLQRSNDNGKSFTGISSFQSDGKGSYRFLDTSPAAGTSLYRLVQNNADNVNSFSNIVTISYQPLKQIITKFEVFPNPATSTVQLKVKADAAPGALSVKIYNMAGLLMMSSRMSTSGSLTQDVSRLQQGNYVIHVTDSSNKPYGTTTFTKK